MKKRALSFAILFLLTTIILAGGQGGIRESAAAPANGLLAYLPVLFKPPVDFTITALEVTQAVQRSDNSVPLVNGKDTVVRIFAQTIAGTSPSNVSISLSATRSGVPLGTLTDGPTSVPSSTSRANLTTTTNFLLPASWLSGSVAIVATVDSAGVVTESNESNNTNQRTLDFNVVPDLEVVIVPIDYTHTGPVNPALYPGQRVDHISDWIERTYPVANVSITYYPTDYPFTGDLTSPTFADWFRLLDEIATLKSMTPNAQSWQVYYGLIPGYQNWWISPGVIGIGRVGQRVSVGIDRGANDMSGELAAHEIGHNLGRLHALCPVNNPPGNIDPSYPYSNPPASIGEYGLDIQGSSATLLSPATYVDMMSYCNPEWLSDYTYIGLYNDQLANGLLVSSDAVPALMIRGTVDAAGAAVLEPVYAFPQVLTAEPSETDYLVELIDDNGAVIASHPVPLFVAEEEGVSSQAIHASVPLPKRPVATVRLYHSGVMVAERQMRPQATQSAPGLALTRSPGQVTLTWNAAGAPALIRYSVDDGNSWLGLAVDVSGGMYQIDPKELPVDNGRFEVILADSPSGGNQLSAP